jgi:hypothetical protein
MRPTSVARALQGLIPPKIATPSSVVSVPPVVGLVVLGLSSRSGGQGVREGKRGRR